MWPFLTARISRRTFQTKYSHAVFTSSSEKDCLSFCVRKMLLWSRCENHDNTIIISVPLETLQSSVPGSPPLVLQRCCVIGARIADWSRYLWRYAGSEYSSLYQQRVSSLSVCSKKRLGLLEITIKPVKSFVWQFVHKQPIKSLPYSRWNVPMLQSRAKKPEYPTTFPGDQCLYWRGCSEDVGHIADVRLAWIVQSKHKLMHQYLSPHVTFDLWDVQT